MEPDQDRRGAEISAWEAEVRTDTTGAWVASLLTRLAQRTGARFVTIAGVDGHTREASAAARISLISPSEQTIDLEALVALAAQMEAFEFGDFYLCDTRADAEAVAKLPTALERALRAHVSFGIVDSFYVALYGRDSALLEWLNETFEIEREYEGPPSGLQFYG